MKKIIILILLSYIILIPAHNSDAYVSVRGYYRSDGTYVQPHVRSDPNGLKYDNYSWTPSQGQLNETYGTRGADWDTPTWVTDPDYYEGKRLYELGLSKAIYPTNNYNVSEPPSRLVAEYVSRGRNLCKEQLLRIAYKIYLKRAPTSNEIAYHSLSQNNNGDLLSHIKKSIEAQRKKNGWEKECRNYESCFILYGNHPLCYEY